MKKAAIERCIKTMGIMRARLKVKKKQLGELKEMCGSNGEFHYFHNYSIEIDKQLTDTAEIMRILFKMADEVS